METWVYYAIVSMVFAGMTSVLAKYGLKEVSGDIALLIRTFFVTIFVWANALLFDNVKTLQDVSRKSLVFLGLSALTTSVSWIYYYRAIKIGQVSTVALIDKGSILIALALSFLLLNEPVTLKTAIGAGFILVGIGFLAWK
ncbi:MAG: hypothetical protein RI894_610 [Bacteroidota bacterium]|jgi:transporter family protein